MDPSAFERKLMQDNPSMISSRISRGGGEADIKVSVPEGSRAHENGTTYSNNTRQVDPRPEMRLRVRHGPGIFFDDRHFGPIFDTVISRVSSVETALGESRSRGNLTMDIGGFNSLRWDHRVGKAKKTKENGCELDDVDDDEQFRDYMVKELNEEGSRCAIHYSLMASVLNIHFLLVSLLRNDT